MGRVEKRTEEGGREQEEKVAYQHIREATFDIPLKAPGGFGTALHTAWGN